MSLFCVSFRRVVVTAVVAATAAAAERNVWSGLCVRFFFSCVATVRSLFVDWLPTSIWRWQAKVKGAVRLKVV